MVKVSIGRHNGDWKKQAQKQQRKPNDLVAFYSAAATDKLSIKYLGSNVMKEEGKPASISPDFTLSHRQIKKCINKQG